MKRVIAYMRVSTEGQTQGQGFDLQWRQIEAFAKERGYRVIRKFRDALSGMGEDSLRKRSELQKALKCARKNNWMIIVASYDRLTRDAAELMTLKVDPALTIISTQDGVAADIATVKAIGVRNQRVGEIISKTTKKALKRLKAEGHALGNPINLDDARRIAVASNKHRAETTTLEYGPIIAGINPDGDLTRKEICESLNDMGLRTPRGKPWTPGNVRRLLERIEELTLRDRIKNDPLYGQFA